MVRESLQPLRGALTPALSRWERANEEPLWLFVTTKTATS